MNWTERQIAGWIAKHLFDRKHLVMVPNCSWPGHECDLLVVTSNLRLIDVEIKISRSDLKADVHKDKWFHYWDYKIDGPRTWTEADKRRPRQWPQNVWKHYYCMPAEVWRADLLPMFSPASGIILIKDSEKFNGFRVSVERQAKPNRQADTLTAEAAIDVARLANLRMWAAYEEADNARAALTARTITTASGVL